MADNNNEKDTNIVGGYTDDKGNVVEQQMTVVSGIETMYTRVTTPDGKVDTYVDKSLTSLMSSSDDD